MTRQVKVFDRNNIELMTNSLLATIDAIEFELHSLKDYKPKDRKYATHLHELKSYIVKEFYEWNAETK